jgi:hypothetical protein
MRLGLHSFDNFRADDMEAPAPPAFLLDAILNQTTRADTGVTAFENFDAVSFDAASFDAPTIVLEQPVAEGERRRFVPIRMVQRTFAFAAPALFLWMLWPGAHDGSSPTSMETVAAPVAAVREPVRPAKLQVVKAASAPAQKDSSAGKSARSAFGKAEELVLTDIVRLAHERDENQPRSLVSQSKPQLADNRDVADRPRLVRLVLQEKYESARVVPVEKNVAAKPAAAESETVKPRVAALLMPRRAMPEARGKRSDAPRLITAVSLMPRDVRSAVREDAPRVRTETREAIAATSAGDSEAAANDDVSLDNRLAAASVFDSYRAALAEDADVVETDS